MFKLFLIIVFSFFLIVYLPAQQFTAGIKLTGLSIHPKDATNANIMNINWITKVFLCSTPE
jgi:hypothetical protein